MNIKRSRPLENSLLNYQNNYNPDFLHPDKVKKDLQTKTIGREIIVLESTSSTMDAAKQLLKNTKKTNGIKHQNLHVPKRPNNISNNNFIDGTTIFAEEQTKGRGRSGRVWICPKSKGLLLTIILRQAIPKEKSFLLTGFTSVAIVETIRDMYGLPAEIDWPNDIVINNKKLGGIIIETQSGVGGPLNYLIGIGINVNLNKHELHGNVDQQATSLAIEKEKFINRDKLACVLLQNLDSWYVVLKERYEFIIEKWQEYCMNIGRKITIRKNNKDYSGILTSISNSGELTLMLDHGHKKSFEIEQAIVVT